MDASSLLTKKMLPALVSSRYLELILLPTEQCNFRCTYCYEDFSIGKMQRDTIDGIKQLIARRADDLDKLKISWFGGEPLSARDVVYEISEFASEIADEKAIKYHGTMTTNGFLLNQNVAKKLNSLGVRDFQISLDGPREIHNKTRVRIDQSGSFDQIWNNLLALKQSDLAFTVMIRIHITPDNYESLFILIEDLKYYFGSDPRFRLFLKAIANLGGPNANAFTTLRGDEKSAAMQKIVAAVDGKIPIVSVKTTQVPYVCYAAQANSFVIRANGTIGKCTVALNSSTNSVGRILKDGSLVIDSEKLQPWMRGLKSLDTKVLQCPLVGIKA